MDSETVSTGQKTFLYSRGQVFLAGLIGGPLGAAITGRKSALALGDSGTAKRLLLAGASLLLLSLVVATLLPTDVPSNGGLALIFFMPVVLLYESKLTSKVQDAFADGASKHSWWRAAGWGAACFVISMVAIVVFLAVVPLNPINTFEYGENVIYYEGDATEEDARQLAAVLEREGVFNPEVVWEMSLLMRGQGDNLLVVRVPFLEPVANTENHEMLRALRQLIQSNYANKRVEVDATNAFGLVTLRVIE